MQRYKLRAAAREEHTQALVGQFTGQPPDLAAARKWSTSREVGDDGSVSALRLHSGGSVAQRGALQAALSGAAGQYFLLERRPGGSPEVIVRPVEQWLAFRPAPRFRTNTLEEAEAKMAHQGTAMRANQPRLNASLAKADEADAAALAEARDSDDEEGAGAPDAGDEEKGVAAAGKGARGGPKGAAGGPPAGPRGTQAGVGQPKDPDEVTSPPGGEGAREDWEHEPEAADDDVSMGEEDAAQDVPAVRPRSGSADSVRKLLRKQKGKARAPLVEEETPDAEAEEEEEDGEEEEDSSESDMEGVDLDEMATKLHSKATGAAKGKPPPARAPTPQGSKQAPQGTKRKQQPTPPPAGKAKRDRTPSVPPAAAPGGATAGGVTEAEIVELLRQKRAMPLKDLTGAFKARLKTKEDRAQFIDLVKRVGKYEEFPPGSGVKQFVLRS